ADIFFDASQTRRRFALVAGLKRAFKLGAAESEVELICSRNRMLFEPGHVGIAPCSILGLALNANERLNPNETSMLPHICPTNLWETKRTSGEASPKVLSAIKFGRIFRLLGKAPRT